MMKIAARPSPEEEIETWTLHIQQLRDNQAKSQAEVERVQRKLVKQPGDPLYVKMLDEAEHWLRRDTRLVNSHQRVLDDMLAKRG